MNDGIDLRRLHVLRTVAHHGTVTAAAARLHLTPSAVSHQLRQLSSDLGVTLTESHGRGLRLTAAGRALVDHADDLHAHWERARADVLAQTDTQMGPLRLCGFPTAVAGLLSRAAIRLQSDHPDLVVHIAEMETPQGFDLLLSGEADIAVVVSSPDGPPLDDRRFEQHLLYQEPLDLIVPHGHPLATAGPVPLAAAAREPWVMPEAHGCDFHPLVRAACTMAGFSPRAAHSVHSLVSIASLVGAGLGVALYPRLAHLGDADVVRVPLDGDPPPSRQLLTAIRRDSHHQPVVAAGLDALHAEIPHHDVGLGAVGRWQRIGHDPAEPASG